MKYSDLLVQKRENFQETKKEPGIYLLLEKEESPEEILRKSNFKIKLVTPTSFGTQIDLFKDPDEEELKVLLKDFTIKIKNKSIFIVQ